MFKQNARILFQGDSITDCGRNREDNPNHYLGHGYAFITAARLALERPEMDFSFINRGVSGNRMIDMYCRFKEDAINHNPDVLSILIGVNDVDRLLYRNCGADAEKFNKLYTILLEETYAQLPNVKVVLMEPFSLPVKGNVCEDWDNWNRVLTAEQEIVKTLAVKFGCIHVPLQQIFFEATKKKEGAYWLHDGVHPTPAGHLLIANQWLSCVKL